LGNLLGHTKVEKAAIGWGLEELEIATHDATTREADSDDE
jgi:protein SHQ1